MPVDLAVAANEVEVPDSLGDEIGDQTVVEAVGDPSPERMHLEEDAFLAELVELRVAIEEAGRDELIENAHDERGKDSEEDVIEREGPGFKDDLARKCVLEGVLV